VTSVVKTDQSSKLFDLLGQTSKALSRIAGSVQAKKDRTLGACSVDRRLLKIIHFIIKIAPL